MSKDWESTFSFWSQGPGETEQQRSENAERQVREAIDASDKLKNRNIRVVTQGSYRNRVNVRRDSDVDIGVICLDSYFYEYPDDNIRIALQENFQEATYIYSTFKNELEAALISKFGRASVTRGNKSFDIKENTYRVEADVVAFFEHRRYTSPSNYLSGIEMIPDNLSPARIRNWPEQHYANGVYKNNQTNRRYKRAVRILKALSIEMAKNRISSAKSIPSFLIECLMWNVPNTYFGQPTFKSDIRMSLAYLFNGTINDASCNEWVEVSGLKYLFRPSQPWSRQSTHYFINDAWNYLGLS